MRLSDSTQSFLAVLDTFSGNKLTRREDLGVLIELATLHRHDKELDELSFLAKFLSNVYAIMKKIGPGAQGYDKLVAQFQDNLPRAGALTLNLVEKSPQDVRDRFNSTYLAMTQDGMNNLLALLYDLSWYKNWCIDHPSMRIG
jgi:hypothetical protein